MSLVQLSATESAVLGADMETREGVVVSVVYPDGLPATVAGLIYRGTAFTLPIAANVLSPGDALAILAPREESIFELGLSSNYILKLESHASLSRTRYLRSWRLKIGDEYRGNTIRASQFPTGCTRPITRGKGEAVVTLEDRDNDGVFESVSH